MDRYVTPPHRLTRMQDAGLARSEFPAPGEQVCRQHTGGPESRDSRDLGHVLTRWVSEFTSAWAAARERRQTLRALKRVDRRLLRDLGIERAQLRDVVDAMVARQAAEQSRNEPRGQHAGMAKGRRLGVRAAS